MSEDWTDPVDWEQIRWDRFAGVRPPIQHVSVNGRSWHWTPRARRLAAALVLLLIALMLLFAGLYGLARQDAWRCQHGEPDACHGGKAVTCYEDGACSDGTCQVGALCDDSLDSLGRTNRPAFR